ncbi:EAL domain-containing protein [Janthinobacterium sp. NKUCC06_STL]|uniref:EAL domain-containing protein n=1 Tax=Janthinobacterium sp. NKUCC06_STL TaxID=2842127 RepID=UPI001C5AAF6D|nr:EAL domain-containing protein [Janthinobacterium sp. NKUCC06_STL]
MKTIISSMGGEFNALRVITLVPGQDMDSMRWLNAMLDALGIGKVENFPSLGLATTRLREGDVDVIVCNVEHGGLMLPCLLKSLDVASHLPRFPHILWVGQPTLANVIPTQKKTIFGKVTGPRIGGLSVAALLLHARLARQERINIGMVHGGGKVAFVDALRQLLLTSSPLSGAVSVLTEEGPTEADVIEALTTGKNLRVMLQPQFDLCTRRIVGAEALLRWHHPNYGEVSPSVLIPMVNRLGLHLLLFSFIETRVIDVLLLLKQEQVELPIALNASAETVCTPGLPERLAEKMQRAGLSPQLLKIELTGDSPVDDELCLSASLNTLRAKGFPVSLDDFGQGSATLHLLAKMTFDELKVDGSFVHDMETNASSRAVITAILSLTRLLNMKLVVEGIEDESSISALFDLGCSTGQGYALARPMELDDFFLCVGKGRGVGKVPGQLPARIADRYLRKV